MRLGWFSLLLLVCVCCLWVFGAGIGSAVIWWVTSILTKYMSLGFGARVVLCVCVCPHVLTLSLFGRVSVWGECSLGLLSNTCLHIVQLNNACLYS